MWSFCSTISDFPKKKKLLIFEKNKNKTVIFVVVKILVVFKMVWFFLHLEIMRVHYSMNISQKILKIKAFNSVIIITSVIIRASPGNGRIVFHLD